LAKFLNRSVLEMSAVQSTTLIDYLKKLGILHDWLLVQNKFPETLEALDETLVHLFDHLFYSGLEVSEGSKIMAAIQHMEPAAHGKLPRAWRAVKGWGKLPPPRTRLPLPWMGLTAMVGALIHLGSMWEAFAMVLQFIIMLPPPRRADALGARVSGATSCLGAAAELRAGN
jgi:hypothetical protein